MVRTAAPIEQRRRSFAGAGRHEGALISPGSARERLVGPEVRWSATRVETYRTCAFQFFGRYGLSLYEVEDELAEADAAIRGTVIHDIMEAALGPLVEDDRPLVPATENEAVRHMRERGRELWLSAPDYYHFGRAALWRLGWEDAANDLERLIHREAIHKRRMARRGRDDELCLNFGKHKERPLLGVIEADPGYIEWMLRSDFTREVKGAIQSARAGSPPQPPDDSA